MDIQTEEQTEGYVWMYRHLDGQTDRWTGRETDSRTDKRLWTDVKTDRWRDERQEEGYGWMYRHLDGRTDRQKFMDGWTDRGTNRQKYK